MIRYDPFWETLREKGISTYTLAHKYRVSGSTLQKLRDNKPVTTTTLDALCAVLQCELAEIAQYVPEEPVNH